MQKDSFSLGLSSSDSGKRIEADSNEDEFSFIRRSWILMQRALIVWILFALLGLGRVPERLVPLVSHGVGFGFYLVIVTRQTRWMLLSVSGTWHLLLWHVNPYLLKGILLQLILWVLVLYGFRG
mmetsp:Transcript_2295/g.4026  ORF Transcript_2295/g.4026 Transcript_2295/m.4026 type:complete len:124 (-) Transcript_2295:724-1095(-)